uniref:Uncharacterized protein n=1 Tax=Arundo donax TaxID=35708 RepID=A0A0A8ZV10_ARUDO
MRMTQYGKLRGHDGCVNTVSFNPSGDILVSSSDDMNIILWDWLAKTKKARLPFWTWRKCLSCSRDAIY